MIPSLERDQPVTLGSLLRERRLELGLTLKDIQKSHGLHNAYLSQIETGKLRNPSLNKILKLSQAYQIPETVLLQVGGIIDPKDRFHSHLDYLPDYIVTGLKTLHREDWESLRSQIINLTKLRRGASNAS